MVKISTESTHTAWKVCLFGIFLVRNFVFGLNTGKHVKEKLQIRTPYSVRMRENKDQENSEYGHLSWRAGVLRKYLSFVGKLFPNDERSVLVFSDLNEEDLNQRECPLIRRQIESAALLHKKQNKRKRLKL